MKLSTKFQSMLERLQAPAARKGMEAAFNATPAALGRAAVEAERAEFARKSVPVTGTPTRQGHLGATPGKTLPGAD